MNKEQLREQFEKETSHKYSFYAGHENFYTHWLETRLLCEGEGKIDSGEIAIGFAEWLQEEGWVKYPFPNEYDKQIWHKVELVEETSVEDGTKSSQQLLSMYLKSSPTHQEADRGEGEKSDIMECESCGWKGDEKDCPDFYYDSEGNKWNDPVCPKCDSTDIDYIKPPPSTSAEQENDATVQAGESYPDTEADGIVFCGKCGKQK